MNRIVNVLIFPCGAENALEAYTALKDIVNINVFGASSVSDHGEYVYENYIPNLPYIDDDKFIPCFIDIITAHKIDVVIPTHDDVVLKLANHQQEIPAKLLVHGIEQAKICRSKKMTYELFHKEAFCPSIYSNRESIIDKELPLFCKPDKGQGGKGAFILDTENYHSLKTLNLADYIITEYLPGEELTVDCFTNFNGVLKFIGPRVRVRVSNGISVRTRTTELTEEIRLIANKINATLNLNGLWYFQLKKSKQGEWKLLEVSLRIAGSMNLYRVKGVNFPLLAVYNAMGIDVSIIYNDMDLEVDRALTSKYKMGIKYSCVYIDFDDTITRNKKVNPDVIRFLYSALNSDIKLHLITKHEQDIKETLEKLKIHEGIFESIIALGSEENKAEYIKEIKESIFIDNAFKERKDVYEKHQIPVFDVDAINSL